MPQKKRKSGDEWVDVQKRTFTNWINDKLGSYQHKVSDLSKDLDDGQILIELVQKLSGKIVPERHAGKPSKSSHKTQNLTAVLSFLSDIEGLPIENITPSHISKHSIKDILSLVWILISHYCLTKAGDEARALLLDWVNAVLPDRDITDLTTCWSDGVNLLTLVNFCRPGLVPDTGSIDSSKGLDNIKQAMQLAKDSFFVPQVMAPQDMAVDRPDEHCVMTYLSYFSGIRSPAQKALFLWVKQQLPDRVEVTNFDKDWTNGHALGALVNTLSSAGFTEYEQFEESNGVDNCQTAMEAAERLLRVKTTLSPQEFADSNLNLLRRTAYLLQLYHATLKVTVTDIHHPDNPGADQMMWVDLSFTGGDLSMIKGHATGADSGVLQTVNEALEEGMYRVSFETEWPDEYSLSVTVGGMRVDGSPFVYSLSPPEPGAVQHINTVIPKKVGIPVIVSFDVSRAGHGELSAKAVGCVSGPIPVSTDTSSPSIHKVSIIPLQSEAVNMTVKFNDVEVEGSPFELPLGSLIHPEMVKLSKPIIEGPGIPVSTSVDRSKAGEGVLEAVCMGDKSGPMDVTITETDGQVELTFTPDIEDMYYLTVRFDGTEVEGSPLKIDLYPQPPDAKMVVLSSPPSGALDPGLPITIGFNTREAGQGEMTAQCVGKSHGELATEVKQTSKYDHEVTFLPPDEDVYNIHILWSDVPIKGSPFKLDLISKDHPEPSKCSILNSPKPSDLLLTEDEIQFKVNTANAGKGVLTVSIDAPVTEAAKNEATSDTSKPTTPEHSTGSHTPSGGSHAPSESAEEEVNATAVVIKSLDDPTVHMVSYTPSKGGQHTINVLWAGEHVPHSPFTVTVIAPQIASVGSPAVVNLKTVYKRKHLKAYAISSNGGPHLKVKMEKIASGDYKLIFLPTEAGVYLLHVSTKDRPIPGSPFVIRYTDNSDPSTIKVSGLAGEAVVGKPIEFVIDAKDAGFGDVTVAPLGSVYSIDSALTRDVDVRSIYLKDNKDGTYSAVFTPDSAGDTSLDIRFGGATVPGSPFPVTVLQRSNEDTPIAAAAAQGTEKKKDKKGKKSKNSSLISGLNLEDEKFLVGTAHKFKIHCEDLGDGDLEVSTKPHSAADVEVTHVADENAYWVEIMPKKPGKNDILVKFGGSHILGSPFRIQFQSRGDAGKCSLIDTPKECQRELENKVSFCISTKGSGKGKITASVKSISTKREVPCEVVRSSKHHYHVIFTPSDGLNYLMSVKYDEVHINGSPYKIALGDASLCRVEGDGLKQAWCGRWNTFRINVEDAGPGELTVSIEGDDPGEQIEGMNIEQNISNVDDNHYEVSYQPFFPGKYWITVKWGNINIPDSPFDVTCMQPLKPEQFTVETVTQTYLGKPAHILVNCDSPIDYQDKMSVSVHSQQDEKISGSTSKNDDNRSYTCTINPPALEKYFVYVLWDEKHVVGSPFEISNVLPPMLGDFTVEAVDCGQGQIAVKVIGPPYCFRYGTLTATVNNSNGSATEFPVNVGKDSDEQCSVDFTPAHGGEYMLGLLYDGAHISGSPFQLLSTDASQCYARGRGVSGARAGTWNKFSVFTENGGPGELRVEVEGESQGEGDVLLNALVTAASDTRYDVSYTPTIPGLYKVSILWDIQHIPDSPFNVYCCDPNRYTIPKRPSEGSLGKPIRVGIMELTAAPEFEQLTIYASTKDHIKYPGQIEKGADGGYICSVTPPKVGKYMVHIQCNGFEINGSPFKVRNYPAPKPDKVLAEGPGLLDGHVGEKGSFVVNVGDAGHGYLSLKVQGPKDGFEIDLKRDTEDEDKILAEYNPTHPGSYLVSLLWSGEHIANSPFTVSIGEAQQQGISLNQLQEASNENE